MREKDLCACPEGDESVMNVNIDGYECKHQRVYTVSGVAEHDRPIR
jgi:hypothetical protein